MLTLMAIAGALIPVAGLLALRSAVRHAPEGREDADGFHYAGTSRPPEPARAAGPALPAPAAVPHDCVVP